jgi:hypothetical protein
MTKHVTVTPPTEPTTYALPYGDTEYVATIEVSASEPLSSRLDAQIQALTLLRDTVRFYERKPRR